MNEQLNKKFESIVCFLEATAFKMLSLVNWGTERAVMKKQSCKVVV